MRIDDTGRMPAALCPAVAALLAHEHIIVPQMAIVRARALARARAALRTRDEVLLRPVAPAMPARRLLFAAAAGVTLLASGALAFQLARPLSSAPPTPAFPPRATRHAQVMPASAMAALAPRPVRRALPARVTMPNSAPGRATGAGLFANQSGENDDTSGELLLLERAHKLNARREHAAVLVLTAEHERRYPAGRLCEEREVLRLRALAGLGRDSEARRTAARFRRDFPQSVLLPKLFEMLATSPERASEKHHVTPKTTE